MHLLGLGRATSESWIWLVVVALGLEMCVRIRRLDEVDFKRVHVLRVVQVVEDKLWVLLVQALLLKPVLNLDQVHAHFNHLLQEDLFPVAEKVLLLLVSTE